MLPTNPLRTVPVSALRAGDVHVRLYRDQVVTNVETTASGAVAVTSHDRLDSRNFRRDLYSASTTVRVRVPDSDLVYRPVDELAVGDVVAGTHTVAGPEGDTLGAIWRVVEIRAGRLPSTIVFRLVDVEDPDRTRTCWLGRGHRIEHYTGPLDSCAG